MFRATRSKRDAGESACVKQARAMGAHVWRITGVMEAAAGFPDIVGCLKGVTFLAECKGGDYSKRRENRLRGGLDPNQARFFREWDGGPLFIWEAPGDVIRDLASMGAGNGA